MNKASIRVPVRALVKIVTSPTGYTEIAIAQPKLLIFDDFFAKMTVTVSFFPTRYHMNASQFLFKKGSKNFFPKDAPGGVSR